MSSYLRLSDGTEFSIYVCSSSRPVVVGFEESELEKLLKLTLADKVTFCGQQMDYKDAQQKMGGPFAGYIPNLADYLKIANLL